MTWNTALFFVIVLMAMSVASAQPQHERGRTIFQEYCQRCHGAQGQGPANIQQKSVFKGPPEGLIKVIAFGAPGTKFMPNGTRRSMVASPYNDADIAHVANYVMQLIGKREIATTEQDVARVRQAHRAQVRGRIGSMR